MKLYIKSIKARNNALCLWIVFNIFLCFDFLKWALLWPKPSCRHRRGFCFRRCRASEIAIGFKGSRAGAGKELMAVLCFAGSGLLYCGQRHTLSWGAGAVCTGLPNCPLMPRSWGEATPSPHAADSAWWEQVHHLSHHPDTHLLWGWSWVFQVGLDEVVRGLAFGKNGRLGGWSDGHYLAVSLAWSGLVFGQIPLQWPSWNWSFEVDVFRSSKRQRKGRVIEGGGESLPVSFCHSTARHGWGKEGAFYEAFGSPHGLVQPHPLGPTPHTPGAPRMPWPCVWRLWACPSLGLGCSLPLGKLQLLLDVPPQEASPDSRHLYLFPWFSLYSVYVCAHCYRKCGKWKQVKGEDIC